MSKISVKVVEGKCQGGHHKLGETFEIDYEDALTPQGMCLGAFGSVFPYIMILLGDGEFRLEKPKKQDKDTLCRSEGHNLRN